ncbi:acetoacetate--CoA ligase [Pseudonocardia bannensis]|uniref:Acetoacetate--CoA ligase n=1 Tax=Pseudonocardia bannensis TaxID=630973 RepID=A0A848DJ63_9PSEU|nr:acetoacetate--CoA ligase [Pseudonocardia bannensis]NMH92521.1 acetoacetate--CoA ligase [Pseudonocardia bannensis]
MSDPAAADVSTVSPHAPGAVLRKPAPDALDTTALGRYVRGLAERGREFADHAALWRWSVDDLEGFWASVWDHFGVRAHTPYERVLASREMPGAQWFPGATLNYAEHMLGLEEDRDRTAVIARSQTREPSELTFGELRDQVARARAGLRRLGIGAGDRVVAYLPNIPEALVAFLATASLGAIWASCAPEFGARSVVDRFAQIEPRVLLTVAGYTYGDKHIDKRDEVAAIRTGLPSVEHVVAVPYGSYAPADTGPGTLTWDAMLSEPGPLAFDPVPFDHPLYVLFSSGTTGLPKVIVHGHGGILLEHLKLHAFNLDTRPGDRALWFTTTAWAMWNITISALLHRAAIVLLDGNPLWPDLEAQWRLAAETGATLMGTSPGFVMACRKDGVQPARWPQLRQIGITGAPLPAEGFDWVYERFGPDVLLNPISGGTDVCSAFVGGGPWLPVYRGELAAPCLGADVAAFDAAGREVVGELGELVVRAPMPSMPVRFWNDPGDARYRSSYFETFPGVWRHGDWVEFSDRGSCVISGRSDATLNRGGVRLGTAEFYTVVEELPEITDSLVVHLEDAGGGAGQLLLFVALRGGATLDDALRGRIRDALRSELSPRHVPDVVHAVPAIPRTLTGKKLETPIKQILRGRPAAEVVSPDAVSDFAAVAAFATLQPHGDPAREG